MKEQYWSKVLLFGEYSMIFDSTALLIPLKLFSAKWACAKEENEPAAVFSRRELSLFCDFLQARDRLKEVIDTEAFEKDLHDGWWLASNVPIGYGLGSSGTVTAAVYDRYAGYRIKDAMRLKDLFSQMESCFHGSSSGIDPLQCYYGKPFKITPAGVDLLPEGFLNNGIHICLIDTKVKSSTKPLVEYFKRKRENESFLAEFQGCYLPLVNDCIDSMITGDAGNFFNSLQSLTLSQTRFFGPMIPGNVAALFTDSYDFHFGIKILGAGGGGYVLGFTDDRQKASSILQNYDVLWLNVE